MTETCTNLTKCISWQNWLYLFYLVLFSLHTRVYHCACARRSCLLIVSENYFYNTQLKEYNRLECLTVYDKRYLWQTSLGSIIFRLSKIENIRLRLIQRVVGAMISTMSDYENSVTLSWRYLPWDTYRTSREGYSHSQLLWHWRNFHNLTIYNSYLYH